MNEYDHDFDHPHTHLNALEAALLAVRPPDHLTCRHCQVRHELVPMGGTGWAVGTIHEDGCPEEDP